MSLRPQPGSLPAGPNGGYRKKLEEYLDTVPEVTRSFSGLETPRRPDLSGKVYERLSQVAVYSAVQFEARAGEGLAVEAVQKIPYVFVFINYLWFFGAGKPCEAGVGQFGSRAGSAVSPYNPGGRSGWTLAEDRWTSWGGPAHLDDF